VAVTIGLYGASSTQMASMNATIPPRGVRTIVEACSIGRPGIDGWLRVVAERHDRGQSSSNPAYLTRFRFRTAAENDVFALSDTAITTLSFVNPSTVEAVVK
jgi:hypothetical protein